MTKLSGLPSAALIPRSVLSDLAPVATSVMPVLNPAVAALGIFGDVFAGPVKAVQGATDAASIQAMDTKLEKAGIAKSDRGELVKNLGNLSGAELKTALTQLDGALAAGKPKDAVADVKMQWRIDDTFAKSAKEYDLGNGTKVSVKPFFRMTNGPAGRAEDMKAKVFDTVGRGKGHDFNKAVHRSAYGRGSPEDVRQVTQALIAKGKLDEVRKKYNDMPEAQFKGNHGDVPRPISDENAVKLLQFDYGVGVDCAGYVQQAFLGVHGGTRGKYGFDSLGDENLYDLKGNKAFKRETTPVHARPGDLMIMHPPKGERSGHTVLIRDHREVTAADQAKLGDYDKFAKPGDKVHVLEVDASWGAGYGDVTRGGVGRRQFLYNETTKQWADVKSGTVVAAPNGPYNGHAVEGFYHPK